jgi:hypothetical protein
MRYGRRRLDSNVLQGQGNVQAMLEVHRPRRQSPRQSPPSYVPSPSHRSSLTPPLDDFGFKHLLWVYSGRRGIHCWVSDPAALALTDSQRGAIVNYLEVIKGEKKMNLMRPLHPMLQFVPSSSLSSTRY